MKEASHCRLCGGRELTPLLSLGTMRLTGVFPAPEDPEPREGPLEVVRCQADCGLVQLRHSSPPEEMYGDGYGYRSSLNGSMVAHLRGLAEGLLARVELGRGDVVLDIGSNDGTLLACFPRSASVLIGVDPTAKKFREHYPPHVETVEEMFPSARLREVMAGRRARIVTSIAMVYDLEDPQSFFLEVANLLAEDGLWLLEQSYLPSMLQAGAYDTICHEHLEYYGLEQIERLATRAGLRVLDVDLNGTNGGSFAVTVCHAAAPYSGDADSVEAHRARERSLLQPQQFERFRQRVERHRRELPALLARMRDEGLRVLGYGASTKGNVLLQFCGITPELLPCIAEINEEKFGRTTPGTRIPIVSEDEARASRPDAFLVLPWHFREGIVAREGAFLEGGGSSSFRSRP